MITYSDPYKDNPYGKLKGSKTDCWFKISFDEAKLYPTDNGYILAGNFIEYSGVVRNFKPENSLTSGLCSLPIYSKEYEISSKDVTGTWQSTKHQPSKSEVIIAQIIKDREKELIGENISIFGYLCFSPDEQLNTYDDQAKIEFITGCNKLTPSTSTGKLPKYELPSSNYKKASSWARTSMTSSDKIDFIKQDILTALKNTDHTIDTPLAYLMSSLYGMYEGDTAFLELYFNILGDIIR